MTQYPVARIRPAHGHAAHAGRTRAALELVYTCTHTVVQAAACNYYEIYVSPDSLTLIAHTQTHALAHPHSLTQFTGCQGERDTKSEFGAPRRPLHHALAFPLTGHFIGTESVLSAL